VGVSGFGMQKCQDILAANLSLALSHYAGSRLPYAAQPWYNRVRYTDVPPSPAVKTVLAKRLLLHTVALNAFTHVWMTDEDVIFPAPPGLRHFVDFAVHIGAAVLQPSMIGSVHPFLHPGKEPLLCKVWATDFVEIQSPLIHRCAFAEVLTRIHTSNRSDYGVDRVWCRYLATIYPWTLCTACAVVESRLFEKAQAPPQQRDPSGSVVFNVHRHSYDMNAANADDRCVRQRFASYDSGCLVLGCHKPATRCTGTTPASLLDQRAAMEGLGERSNLCIKGRTAYYLALTATAKNTAGGTASRKPIPRGNLPGRGSPPKQVSRFTGPRSPAEPP